MITEPQASRKEFDISTTRILRSLHSPPSDVNRAMLLISIKDFHFISSSCWFFPSSSNNPLTAWWPQSSGVAPRLQVIVYLHGTRSLWWIRRPDESDAVSSSCPSGSLYSHYHRRWPFPPESQGLLEMIDSSYSSPFPSWRDNTAVLSFLIYSNYAVCLFYKYTGSAIAGQVERGKSRDIKQWRRAERDVGDGGL